MRITDQRRVVPPDERAVQRRADTRIGLGADDDEAPDPEVRERGLQGGVLEGVTVALFDERLRLTRPQFGDDLPGVAPRDQPLVGVPDPDDGGPRPPRPVDEAADVGDDGVARVRPRDDAILHVDDEEGGGGPVLEGGHGLS